MRGGSHPGCRRAAASSPAEWRPPTDTAAEFEDSLRWTSFSGRQDAALYGRPGVLPPRGSRAPNLPIHVVVLMRRLVVRHQRDITRTADAVGLEDERRAGGFDLRRNAIEVAGERRHFDGVVEDRTNGALVDVQ